MAIDFQQYTFYPLFPLEDLPPGERAFIDIGDEPVVLFNIDGEVFAIGDRCTHDDGPLGEGEVEDHRVTCPRHGAKFDIRSGKALTLPAIDPTTSYPIRIKDGMVEIGIFSS